MQKLRMDVEALEVETFEAAETVEARGTVRANNDTVHGPTCFRNGGETCAYHCTWWPGTGCEG